MNSRGYAAVGLFFSAVFSAGLALAGPQDGVVTAGQAVISTPSSSVTQITQQSMRAVIDWGSFDIAAGETARFVQPGSRAIAINRIGHSGQASFINGAIEANGHVLVVNPNGVLIGKTGRIDVAGFGAMTADIDDRNFMAGARVTAFDRAGRSWGRVENRGVIRVADEGLAFLVAPEVENSGVIAGRLARIELAAGDIFAVDFFGDGLLHLALSVPGAERAITAENSGSLIAEGGAIRMTAAEASSAVSASINTTGYIAAQSAFRRGGKIILAGKGADIGVKGTVDASGLSGGEIMIGGGLAGTGPVPRAAHVDIHPDARVAANGPGGKGGLIAVWSDQHTASHGVLEARGESLGGLIETSSGGGLDVTGMTADTRAMSGPAGFWVLDPEHININANGVMYNPSAHNNADSGGTANINVSTIRNALSNVLLAANGDISFNTDVSMNMAGVGIYARAGRRILAAGRTISTQGGAVSFEAGQSIDLSNATLVTNGGAVLLDSGVDIVMGDARIEPGGGRVRLSSAEGVLARENAILITADDFPPEQESEEDPGSGSGSGEDGDHEGSDPQNETLRTFKRVQDFEGSAEVPVESVAGNLASIEPAAGDEDGPLSCVNAFMQGQSCNAEE